MPSLHMPSGLDLSWIAFRKTEESSHRGLRCTWKLWATLKKRLRYSHHCSCMWPVKKHRNFYTFYFANEEEQQHLAAIMQKFET